MAQRKLELTYLQVKHLPIGTHALGGSTGLYLRRTASRAWYFFRYTDATGRRRDMTLGNFSSISLKEAKALARDARSNLEEGIDPIGKRQQEKAAAKAEAIANSIPKVMTFGQLAMEWLKYRAGNGYWRNNQKGEKDTLRVLNRHVMPSLGRMDIEAIHPEQVRDCLAPIWQSIPSTARKAKTYISQVINWAIAMRKRTNQLDPTDLKGPFGVLMEPFQQGRKGKTHHPACPVSELPQLMKAIYQYDSISAKATAFAILTAARSQAVRMATWSEFNLEKGTWTIPASHDKIKLPNRDRTIFLSRQAVSLLRGTPRFVRSHLVFSSNGRVMSNMALPEFIEGLHEKKYQEDQIGWIDPMESERRGEACRITLHGTARSTFRTWAKDDVLGNNKKFDQEAVELCLLHSKNDAYQGAYDRARLVNERREIMQCWADYALSLCNTRQEG